MLIAISAENGPEDLFHFEGTSFHSSDGRAIGTGAILASHLISDLCFGAKTVEDLASFAACILSKVKARVEYCGGFTDLIAIKSGRNFALTDSNEIEVLEGQFKGIEAEVTEHLKQQITSKMRVKLKWLAESYKQVWET